MKKTILSMLGLVSAATAFADTTVVVRDPIIVRPICMRSDLVVSMSRPVWDAAARQSVMEVQVTNAGSGSTGGAFVVALQEDGIVYSKAMGELSARGSGTLTFRVNGWVYDPDASIRLTVDSGSQINECNESNNVFDFFEIG